jgi:hypothetical protein
MGLQRRKSNHFTGDYERQLNPLGQRDIDMDLENIAMVHKEKSESIHDPTS